MLNQPLPAFSERQASGRAVEQQTPHGLLQRGDAAAYGGVIDTGAAGGIHKPPVAGNGEEVAQVVPVEHAELSGSVCIFAHLIGKKPMWCRQSCTTYKERERIF